jgi:hypothetical protein
LTREINQIHRSQKDKYVDELLFLVLVIVPVYGIGMIADAVILNTIEFWTGKNPLTSKGDTHNTIAQNGQELADIEYDSAKGTVELIPVDRNGTALVLSRTDEGVVAMDRSGKVLFTSMQDTKGGVTVLDANHQVVKYFTPDAVEKGRIEFFQN